jgi:hypothetical protein
MKEYDNIAVNTIEELNHLIESAQSINAMDGLRYACVKFMNSGYPEVLKKWQDKYWSLKRCPTCGHIKGEK